MYEILGGSLERAFEELGVKATKTYEFSSYFDNRTQIWELDRDNFDKLNNLNDDEWKSSYGWYRYADGSNLDDVHKRYSIKNKYIKAWDGQGRIEQEEENKTLPVDERMIEERKYESLLQYITEEIGASTEKNVTAIAIDLAKQNNMKLSELFKKYQ